MGQARVPRRTIAASVRVAKNTAPIVAFAHPPDSKRLATSQAPAKPPRLRFRPIIITSFAFILGVTFFGVVLTPVFHYVIIRPRRKRAE